MGNQTSYNTLNSNATYSAVVEPIMSPIKTTVNMKKAITTTKVSMAITQSVSVAISSIKSSLAQMFQDLVTSFSGTSVVLTEIEEAWYEDMLNNIERRCAQLQAEAYETSVIVTDCETSQFLCPRDTVVQTIISLQVKHKRRMDDDCVSCTTDATDVFSDDEVIYASDSDDFHDDESDGEEEEEEDVETQADQLLCLSPSCPSSPLVYVEDYLCPCGECPQYKRIVRDVETTMSHLSPPQQTIVIRVLQAFSTYHEVIGYRPEMLTTAEECLYVWCGDENQALQSLVMLYDEVPQLVQDDYPQWIV